MRGQRLAVHHGHVAQGDRRRRLSACPPARPSAVSASTICFAGIEQPIRCLRRQPSRRSNSSAASTARAGSSPEIAVSASVLMMIARWNSPFAAGNAESIAVFPPPPDCPKIVTLPRIAAEPRDVVAHPFERGHQIEQRQVRGAREALAGAGQPGKPQVAERIQPVIDADGDDVVLPRELGAIVEDRVSRSRALAAAMEPHHHRPLSGAG